ncbi:MAG TPA: sensor histidine kinase [Bacteroidales bacterium]|nr:sensor histidine kinase [Bacteroidales bacterium]
MKSLVLLIISTLLMQFNVLADIFFMNGQKRQSNVSSIIIDGQPVDTLFKEMQDLVYSNPDSARILADNVLKKLDDNEWQIRILNLIGTTCVVQSNHFQAFESYHKALKLSIQSNNPERIGDSYNNLGVLNLSIKNNKDALENFLAAIQNYELASIPDKINVIHCNLGILYLDLSNVEKAFYHFHRSQNGFLDSQDSQGLAIVYSHLAASLLQVNQPDSAMFYAKLSIQVANSISDLYTSAFALTIEGNIYLKEGDFKSAEAIYKESLEISEKINSGSLITTSQLGLARINLEQNNTDKALEHAYKALEEAEITNSTELIYDVFEVLSAIYEQTEDFEKALSYYKSANNLKIALNDQSKLHQLYYMEINQLIKDKEAQLLEIEKQKLSLSQRNSLLILLGLLFIAIIIIILLIYNNHINKVKQEQAVKFNEAVVKLTEERSKAAFDAEIQERKRLGLELHDSIGPMLSLAKLNLTALLERSDLASERKSMILNNTVSTLNEILREMKHIVQNMAPIVLIEKGFRFAIENLVLKLNETEKYTVTLDISGLNEEMDQYLEHALYRAILEVVNNILSHADGSEINIQIIQNHEDITIMIEDNGIGFNPQQHEDSKGIGLKSLVSRIEGLKGKVFIDSVVGRGTIVTIVVPV